MFTSLQEIIQLSQSQQKSFWEVILEDDMTERKVSREESIERMRMTWDAILLAEIGRAHV